MRAEIRKAREPNESCGVFMYLCTYVYPRMYVTIAAVAATNSIKALKSVKDTKYTNKKQKHNTHTNGSNFVADLPRIIQQASRD